MIHISVPIASGIGAVTASVLVQAAAPSSPGMDPDQLFVLELLKAIVPGIGAVAVGAIGAWFAASAAKRAGEAAKQTASLAEKTTEMSGRLDGKLEKMMALIEAKAFAEGQEMERQRAEKLATTVAAQTKLDAATVRAEAKEDRAEGAAQTAPAPVQAVAPGTTEEPVHMIIANLAPIPVIETPAAPEEKAKPKKP